MLRRNGRKPAQAAVEVDDHREHPGKVDRRVRNARFSIGRGALGDQRGRRLPVPIADRGGRLRKKTPPLLHVVSLRPREIDRFLVAEKVRRPVHGAIGIAQIPENVARLRGQDFRRILQRNQIHQVKTGNRDTESDQAQDDSREGRNRNSWRKRFVRARFRHKFGRRSDSIGQGGGQRIAAGQHRRQRHGRCRPHLRIAIEAAENRHFDGFVQVPGQRRWRSDPVLLPETRHFRDGVRLERHFAGEHLVKDQSHRVKIALSRDFRSCELLGRHVRGRAAANLVTLQLLGDCRQSKIGHAEFAP